MHQRVFTVQASSWIFIKRPMKQRNSRNLLPGLWCMQVSANAARKGFSQNIYHYELSRNSSRTLTLKSGVWSACLCIFWPTTLLALMHCRCFGWCSDGVREFPFFFRRRRRVKSRTFGRFFFVLKKRKKSAKSDPKVRLLTRRRKNYEKSDQKCDFRPGAEKKDDQKCDIWPGTRKDPCPVLTLPGPQTTLYVLLVFFLVAFLLRFILLSWLLFVLLVLF